MEAAEEAAFHRPKFDVQLLNTTDMEAGAVSARLHHSGPQGAKPMAEVIENLLAVIKERQA